MKTAKSFLQDNNFLDLQINHCDYGSFPELLHSYDTIPYNRFFIIPSESECRESYIRDRTKEDPVIPLESGQIYFIPADIDLEYSFRKELKLVGLHFGLELYPGLDIFREEKHITTLSDNRELGNRIWEELGKGDSLERTVLIRAMALQMAGFFIGSLDLEVTGMLNIRRKYGVVLDWIRENINATIEISDLAEVAGQSRDSLSRGFSRETGMTLKEYLNRELVKEASRLLLFSEYRVNEIARQLGFNDEYYFSRFIKKHTGLSPGKYRKIYGR